MADEDSGEAPSVPALQIAQMGQRTRRARAGEEGCGMNPSREDYLLFAQYSDQIDRSVRAEVDACVSVFPSRQPFHAACVMDESEFKQRRARAQEAEAHRLNRIEEAQPLGGVAGEGEFGYGHSNRESSPPQAWKSLRLQGSQSSQEPGQDRSLAGDGAGAPPQGKTWGKQLNALYCPYDTPEPRMTWLGVIWGAAVVFALSVRDVLARLMGSAG